ncbi:MAG: CHAT domain-containing protein [Ardenticatenales bacterium]|nr:CHAT domain-containing protein [Ardenticatenales bacterium]
MVRFEDFHLIVNGSGGRYTVEARGAGEVSTPQVPLLYEETDDIREWLGRLQAGTTLTRQQVEVLGTHLYNALFPPIVARAYSSAREAVTAGTSLRLKLNLRPPELARLPWELLFDPHTRTNLAGRRSQPLVRTVDSSAGPVGSLRLSVPPRILQVEAQPNDRAMLDELERSRTALVAAWGRQVDVVTLAAATPSNLRVRLAEKPGFHILHYDGHATFEEVSENGYLVLEDADGTSHPLAGPELADYLDGTPVRLVVLAACLTGRNALERRFCGIAQHLMHTSNLPAVVAMQYPVSDAGARAFIEGFYSALASGEPLEIAVTAGRLAIREEAGAESVSEWAAPVLFMRTTEGDLFAPEPEEGDAVPWLPPEITPLSEPAAEGVVPSLHGNPFTPGAVVPPERFVGRKKEVEAILGRLEGMLSVSLVGEARIGKTSLLRYLEAYLPTLLGAKGCYLPLYLSMNEQRSQSSFSRAILEKLLPQVVPPQGKLDFIHCEAASPTPL